MSYADSISFTYTSPGSAHKPENALLAYIGPNEGTQRPFTSKFLAGEYWIGVKWQASTAGVCDPDLTFKGTVLIFEDKFETVEMYAHTIVFVSHIRNKTGLIKYPHKLEKCDIVGFTAMTMCYATDGKNEFHINSTQLESSPLQVVIPLPAPVNGSHGVVNCTLDKDLYRNCTILLQVSPYDCGCGGNVQAYELNTTCTPMRTQPDEEGATLNCTTSDFTPSATYRASCVWNAPNSPTSDLVSLWSDPTILTVNASHLAPGKDVPRPPFPLVVIICSAVFVGIGLVITVAVLVKRATSRRSAGYTAIQ